MLALTGLIISISKPLPANDHDKLLNFGWFLPTPGVLLACLPIMWAQGSQWWWLVRIALASLIGVGLLVSWLCDAARYNDSRNSGVGTAFMLFAGIGWMLLLGLVFILSLAILARWPIPAVFKWVSIVIGTLSVLGGLLGWLDSLETSNSS